MFNTDELRNIPVIEVAKRLGIQVKNKKAMCFNNHDRKTPSLSFNTRENYWNCFGCNQGGDSIRLVQKYYGCSFEEACTWLSKEFNIPFNLKSTRVKSISKTSKVHNNSSASDFNKADIEVYEWLINSTTLGKSAHKYLVIKRKFKEEVLNHFNIRSIENPSKFFTKAKNVWGIERLLKCGLAKLSDEGTPIFVWSKPVVLFPFYDLDNKLIYLQGRRIGEKISSNKYLNLFCVETQIYNLNVINRMRKNDILYIFEGAVDALSAYQMGLNAIGILGAYGFREKWARNFTDFRIRVIPDNDISGEIFAESIEKAFRLINKEIQIMRLEININDFTDYRISRGK